LQTPLTEASGKRQHVRFALTAKAQLVVKSDTRTLDATMLDLSKKGCLLTLAEPCPIESGALVDVLFQLNRKAFRVGGAVTTCRADNRVAIQFDQVDAGFGRQLGTLSSARSRGKDSRREEPVAPHPPAHPSRSPGGQ
jgi:c-di-GMP-binding flagellar brake protein YcgR